MSGWMDVSMSVWCMCKSSWAAELKDARKLLRSAKAEVMRGRGRDGGGVGEEAGGGKRVQSWRRMGNLKLMQRWQWGLKHLKRRLSFSVQRKMLDSEIDTLQSLYRKAIVDHPGDLAGMGGLLPLHFN